MVPFNLIWPESRKYFPTSVLFVVCLLCLESAGTTETSRHASCLSLFSFNYLNIVYFPFLVLQILYSYHKKVNWYLCIIYDILSIVCVCVYVSICVCICYIHVCVYIPKQIPQNVKPVTCTEKFCTMDPCPSNLEIHLQICISRELKNPVNSFFV